MLDRGRLRRHHLVEQAAAAKLPEQAAQALEPGGLGLRPLL